MARDLERPSRFDDWPDGTGVGFVGLGAMGEPMVSQLVAHDRQVVAYDLDATRVEAAARAPGVTAAMSLADLSACAVVVCMLPDSDAVESVTLGPAGLFASLEKGALVVDMGSSHPSRTVALSGAATDAGVELVDAPVSGGVARARTGELTVMFGGRQEQLERCRPVLDAVASTVVHVGGVGAGHSVKALNNVMSAVGLSIACEVIEVGRRMGVDPAIVLDVLNGSTGRNHATETKMEQYVLSGSFDSGFLLRLMLKDLATAIDVAHGVGAAVPIGEACLALWRDASERLPPDADQTRIWQVLVEGRDPPSTA